MRLVSAVWGGFYPFDDMLPGIPLVEGLKDPSELQRGDIVILWGGGDISPSLYNKDVSSLTNAGPIPSRLDSTEWGILQKAKELECVIIGVCRGGQLLTAAAGGYLIQHLDNHAGRSHLVRDITGEEYVVNSIHHQMMIPPPKDVSPSTVLAWAAPKLSKIYYDVDSEVEIEKENELIYYQSLRGLAIQWHPEAMKLNSPASMRIKNILESII